MLGQLENLAAIGALALEHRAGIVQAMGQHVDLGVRPFDELAVHPDKAVKLVEGNGCHDNLPRATARTVICRCSLSAAAGVRRRAKRRRIMRRRQI